MTIVSVVMLLPAMIPFLWELVRSCPDKLREVAETLRSNMSLEYVLQVFNEEQMGNWCERIYNKGFGI
ncbi:hypothetical protein NXW89_19335 [Bacteroides thetaiotaomicron]|nr:hypothetical protein [Bacteroides thetaiotaomicron]